MQIKEAIYKTPQENYMKGGSLSQVFHYQDIVVKLYSGNDPRGYSKLQNEANYLKNIPKSIKSYFPEVIEIYQEENLFSFAVKYYKEMKSLTELSMGDVDIQTIWQILKEVLDFCNNNIYSLSVRIAPPGFLKQTQFSRVKEALNILSGIKEYQDLLQLDRVVLNGEKLINSNYVLDIIQNNYEASELLKLDNLSLFHGNFHMDNILTDLKGFLLIDPRGDLLGYKDYDTSKMLCHLYTRYDEIHRDLFSLKVTNGGYSIILTNKVVGTRYDFVQQKFIEYECGINDINLWSRKMLLLAGFHAISFSSYHARKQNPNIQRVLTYYLCGIKLVNDYLNNKQISVDKALIPYS